MSWLFFKTDKNTHFVNFSIPFVMYTMIWLMIYKASRLEVLWVQCCVNVVVASG